MILKLSSRIQGLPKRHSGATFDNFIVDESNKKHFDICNGWDGTESIFLTGNTGTGKTHLAIAMLKSFPMIELPQEKAFEERNRIEIYADREQQDPSEKKILNEMLKTEIWKYRNASCLFVSIVEMFIELNEAAQNKDGKKVLLDRYSGQYDCICFDDFGAEKLTDAKRENFYYIIDKRYRDMKTTIVTSNFTIKEISNVEPRIASRFTEMGKILQFEGVDYRKKMGTKSS